MSLQIDQPVYGIVINEDQEGNPWMGLLVQTSSVSLTVYLADPQNYREVARKLHDGIIRAGKDMNTLTKKLIVADGPLPSANGHRGGG
jgi:hypothetical protein